MSMRNLFTTLFDSGQERPSRPSEYLTLAYLWFVLLLLAGLGAASEVDYEQLRAFVLFGSSASLLVAVSLLAAPRAAMRSFPYVHTALCFLPLALPYSGRLRSTMFLSAFYVGLMLLPPILSVWSWRVHRFVAAGAVIAALLRLWAIESPHAAVSGLLMPLVGLAAVLFSAVNENRRRGRTRSIAALESLQTVFRISSIWPVASLQVALLMFLVVFEQGVLGTGSGTSAKVYAAFVVIFGALLLTILRPNYRSSVVLFNVLLVGVLLSVGSLGVWREHLNRPSAWLWTFLPLVFLAHSTAALPWPVTMQVLISWGLTLCGLLAFVESVFPDFPEGGSETALLLERGAPLEITFLVCGIALAVFVSRAVRQHRLVNFPRLSGPDYFAELFDRQELANKLQEAAPPEELAWSCADGILFERMSQMLQGLFIVGFAACLGMSMLSAGTLGVPLSWGLFVSLWLLVLFLARRNLLHDWLGAFGSFAGLMLYLAPTSMILYLGIREGPWLIFPLGLMMSLSIIPWQLSEIVPLICTGVFVSSYLLSGMHSGGAAYIALFGSACISVLWSVRSYRETKEQYLLNHFQEALATARGPRDCQRLLGDFLTALFGSDGALAATRSGAVDLVRNMRAFPINSDSPPCRALAKELAAPASGDRVVLEIVDGFDPDLFLFDARFGVFSADQGALLIFPGQAESGEASMKAWVFVPLVTPLPQFLLRRECAIARSLAAQALTKMSLFCEQSARVTERAQTEQIRARQEYEWSSVVHDINNTVQDVTMLCDAAAGDLRKLGAADPKQESVREDALARVERIKTVARSMAVLVSDTKRRRELKRLRDLRPREFVNVRETVEVCLAFATVRAERRRVAIKFGTEINSENEGTVAVQVSAREHLETVIRTILTGAINASRPGTTVQVRLSASEDWIWFLTSDSGPGYSAAELEALFSEDADKVSGYRSSEVSYLDVRRFAESQGGVFEIASQGAGKGATASLKLPRAADERPRPQQPNAWALLVDDEALLTVSYSRIAKALGLEPVVATTVDDAKDLLQQRSAPTLVVTDLNLGNDGFVSWIEYLRQTIGAAAPIVVVTGLEESSVETQVRACGVAEYILKPVGQRSLYSAIRGVLEKGRENGTSEG